MRTLRGDGAVAAARRRGVLAPAAGTVGTLLLGGVCAHPGSISGDSAPIGAGADGSAVAAGCRIRSGPEKPRRRAYVLYEDFTFPTIELPCSTSFFESSVTPRPIVCDLCCDTRGADIRRLSEPGGLIVNKRHWSAVSGLAVGALVVTGLTAPMQAQATPVAKAPVSGDPAAAQASQPGQPAQPPRRGRRRPSARTPSPSCSRARPRPRRSTATASSRSRPRARTRTARPSKSKYVNYPVNREEDIFTILTDFGDQTKRRQPTAPPVRCTTRSPQPDRNVGRQRDRRQLDVLGSRTSTASTTMDMMFGDGRVVQGLLPQAVQRPLPRQG